MKQLLELLNECVALWQIWRIKARLRRAFTSETPGGIYDACEQAKTQIRQLDAPDDLKANAIEFCIIAQTNAHKITQTRHSRNIPL